MNDHPNHSAKCWMFIYFYFWDKKNFAKPIRGTLINSKTYCVSFKSKETTRPVQLLLFKKIFKPNNNASQQFVRINC